MKTNCNTSSNNTEIIQNKQGETKKEREKDASSNSFKKKDQALRRREPLASRDEFKQKLTLTLGAKSVRIGLSERKTST